MRLSPAERIKLTELCWKRIDGTIESEELILLRGWLEKCGGAQREFVRCLWLDIDLYTSNMEGTVDLDEAIAERVGGDALLSEIAADHRSGLERCRAGRTVAA